MANVQAHSGAVGAILGWTPLLADVGLGLLFVKSARHRATKIIAGAAVALSSVLSFLVFAVGLMAK